MFNNYRLNLAVIVCSVVSVKILPIVYLVFLELVWILYRWSACSIYLPQTRLQTILKC